MTTKIDDFQLEIRRHVVLIPYRPRPRYADEAMTNLMPLIVEVKPLRDPPDVPYDDWPTAVVVKMGPVIK